MHWWALLINSWVSSFYWFAGYVVYGERFKKEQKTIPIWVKVSLALISVIIGFAAAIATVTAIVNFINSWKK